MKALITQEEFNGLNEALQAEYVNGGEGVPDGMFQAKIETVNGWALEDVAGLKNTLSAVRTERNTFKATVDGLDGLDVADARKKIAQLDELLSKNPEGKAKAEIEAAKAQLIEKHAGELDEVNKALAARDKEVHDLVVVADATAALSKHGGNVQLMLPHVVSQIKVARNEEGRPVSRVKDNAGGDRVSMRQGNNGPMDVDELVGEIMKSDDQYKAGFEGSGASGTGSTGKDTSAGNGSQPVKFGGYAQALADQRSAGG